MANGSKELEFWGASIRERARGGVLYASAMRSAIAQDVDAEFQAAKSGARGRRQPTDLPESVMRFLHVEASFISLAVKGAVEFCGGDHLSEAYYRDLPQDMQRAYSAMVERGAREVRSLCEWVYVHRRNVHQYRFDEAYQPLALLGYTRHGFGELLRKRIEAVKAEIEGRTYDEGAPKKAC